MSGLIEPNKALQYYYKEFEVFINSFEKNILCEAEIQKIIETIPVVSTTFDLILIEFKLIALHYRVTIRKKFNFGLFKRNNDSTRLFFRLEKERKLIKKNPNRRKNDYMCEMTHTYKSIENNIIKIVQFSIVEKYNTHQSDTSTLESYNYFLNMLKDCDKDFLDDQELILMGKIPSANHLELLIIKKKLIAINHRKNFLNRYFDFSFFLERNDLEEDMQLEKNIASYTKKKFENKFSIIVREEVIQAILKFIYILKLQRNLPATHLSNIDVVQDIIFKYQIQIEKSSGFDNVCKEYFKLVFNCSRWCQVPNKNQVMKEILPLLQEEAKNRELELRICKDIDGILKEV